METKKKRQSWDHLNTLDDFNKFIEENDIKCPSDFQKRFSGLYKKARKLNILKDLIYENRTNNWNHLNTPDDFNKFIEENNVKTPEDLKKRFGSVYNKTRKLNILKDLIFENRYNDWSYLNTIDDFNKFIEENNIKNPTDFKKRFGSVYGRAQRLNILKDLIFENRLINDWSYLNTIDDFNKFIEENNIKSPTDFNEKFGGVHDRARRLNILDELIYPERRNNWDHLNTSDDFNKFIEENNIKGRGDFSIKFSGVYNKSKRLGLLDNLIYCKGKKEKSSWEVDIYDIIINIPEFINPKREVKFKDCKNKRELPFDIVFSLPNGKIVIIEIQGPRHYTREFGEKKYIPVRKNDLIKYRWAKEQNNVYLFYFSKPNYRLKENSYFHYIYTSEEELLNDIKKLI